MTSDINDTYYFLYDQPDHRRLEFCAYAIQYRTAAFSRTVYERERGMVFASEDDAYLDWMAVGRTLGLPYAEGKNTYLKILLKVKDEPELIVQWIEYHAAIVGYDNLIIMNCGSTDSSFLAILHSYRERVLILDYEQYYDELSFPGKNIPLFALLMRNCKYLTVLDADEFLFGYKDGQISRANVADIVREGQYEVYPGAWITNHLAPPDLAQGGIDFSQPITFALDADSLRAGAIQGKSVVRASRVFDLHYVGHNLHLREVMRFIDARAFGKLFVFHLANLSPALVRARALKHLYAKGVVPRDMPAAEIAPFLTHQLDTQAMPEAGREYARRYLSGESVVGAAPLMAVNLSYQASAPETHAAFTQAIERFDFAGLLQECFDSCKIFLSQSPQA